MSYEKSLNEYIIYLDNNYDKFDFVSPWGEKKTTKPRLHPNLRQVCVNVRSENCLARFDNVPYRTYRKRGHEEKY